MVFYHFGGVDNLMREAFDSATRRLVAEHTEALREVTSFTQLHQVGCDLAATSKADGSASLLAQSVAAAHTDPEHAQLLAHSLHLWHEAVSEAVARLLREHGLTGALDADELARAVAASSIGMMTLDALPNAPLGATMESLRSFTVIADRVARILPAPVARAVFGVTQRLPRRRTTSSRLER